MYEDEDLQEIHEDILELNEDISTLRRDLDNISASVEGSGENVTLNGTAEARFKKPPLPMGNSEQESTTGRNLWINEIEDGETINGITVTKNKDGSLTFNGTATNLATFYFVKSNSTGKYYQENQPYTLSGVGNMNTKQYTTCITGGFGNHTTNDIFTITLGSTREITKDNSYIQFSNGTVLNNYTVKPFVELGTTQGDYEPYTNGASPNPDYPQTINNVTGDVEVKAQNKNLWNNELETAEYNNTGTKITTRVWVVNTQPISVKPNTTYIVSQKETPTQYRIKYFNNNTYLSDISNTQNITSGYKNYSFTTPANCNKIYIQLRSTLEKKAIGTYDITPTDITDVQLEQGTTATSYVSHQEQTFTFPLGNEKLMLGDYLADDGIHHVRGQYAFTGNENIQKYSQSTYAFGIYTDVNIKHSAIVDSVLCNKLQHTNLDTIWRNRENTNNNLISSFTTGFCIMMNNYTDVNDLKEYLTQQYQNETPVIAEYELAEEVIVPYTSAQQTAYNQIKQALSYEEQTNISSNQNALFDVKAFRNMNTSIESLQSRIELLKGRS